MAAAPGHPRPMIPLSLDNGITSLIGLIDTGACRSLVKRDVAIETMRRLGRPLVLKRISSLVTSLTGTPLDIKGEVELLLHKVGPIKFLVVEDMKHDVLIGYDQMIRYGYSLSPSMFKLSDTKFAVIGGSAEIANVSKLSDIPQFECPGLGEVLYKHRSVFSSNDKLPAGDLPALEIKTIPGVIVNQRPYRTPLVKRDEIETEIDKMLALGVIRPSSSAWASPVTLVPKKDGTTRFCCDYRLLNTCTIKDRYPLPLIQDVFDTLGGSCMYSTLDLKTGYWQLPVHPDSIDKTAFVCHYGQYEWLRMPFGLCNAPAVFQRAMNKVLAKHIGKTVMVYLDDIIIFSKSAEQHAKDVDEVLQTLASAGLTLKESKCHFGKSKVDLLGYVISKDGIAAQPSKTQAIQELPPPENIKELRSFLGMCSYYRQLVPRFAEIAEPLTSLTRKNVHWHWNSAHQAAFEVLKDALTSGSHGPSTHQ